MAGIPVLTLKGGRGCRRFPFLSPGRAELRVLRAAPGSAYACMEAVFSPWAGGAALYFLVDPAALIVPSLGEGRSSLGAGLIWEQGHSYSPRASLDEK